MTKSRQWTVGAVLAAVLILVVGFVLVVQPKRSEASALAEQTASQDSANTALQSRIATLKAQKQDLATQLGLLATIRGQLPATPELPTLVRTLTDTAKAAGVELVDLEPANPQPLTTSQSPQTGGTAGSGGSAKSSRGESTSSGTGQSTAASAVQQVPLKISVVGNYGALTAFLGKLESLQRAVLVSEVSVANAQNSSSGASGDSLRMDLSAFVFFAPDVKPPTSAGTGNTGTSGTTGSTSDGANGSGAPTNSQ